MNHRRNTVIRAEGGSLKWFKLHHEVMFDSKVQTLPPELFRSWVNVLCMASANKSRGVLPDIKQVAYVFHTSKDEAAAILGQLVEEGLVVEDAAGNMRPHNWEARQGREDSSTERVRRYREKTKESPPKASKAASRTGETGVKQNETRFDAVTKRLRNGSETGDVTPHETHMKRDETVLDEIRGEEKREREEESLSDDNDSWREGDVVVVDGGTFQVVSPEHLKTIDHARAVVGEKFAAVVADRGSSLDSSLGGRWDCYRAAIDQLKACPKVIDKPAVYCRQMALNYATHGIPTVAEEAILPTAKPRFDRKGNPILTPEQEAEKRERLRAKFQTPKESAHGG